MIDAAYGKSAILQRADVRQLRLARHDTIGSMDDLKAASVVDVGKRCIQMSTRLQCSA